MSHKVPVNALVGDAVMQDDSSAKAKVHFQDGPLTWLLAGGLSSSLCGPLHWSAHDAVAGLPQRQKETEAEAMLCLMTWPQQ